jgi:hypothetical protein
MSTALAAQPELKAGDQYIRQQDSCTPWGLHYIAYQDTYYVPAQPSRRSSGKPARTVVGHPVGPRSYTSW